MAQLGPCPHFGPCDCRWSEACIAARDMQFVEKRPDVGGGTGKWDGGKLLFEAQPLFRVLAPFDQSLENFPVGEAVIFAPF